MSVLSKILLKDYSMCYNCYELGHTWTPSCSQAALDMGWCTFQEAIKMYSALYALNQIISRRADVTSTSKTIKSIMQSSIFLGFNAYAVILIFCTSRRVLGKFYYLFAAHIPAIVGSYLAIQLEIPSRRSALSFYVANIAGETVFNKLRLKGWFPSIPKGEVALFAASTAGLLYLIHRDGFGKDPVSSGLRFLLGSELFSPLPTNQDNSRDNKEVEVEEGTTVDERRKGLDKEKTKDSTTLNYTCSTSALETLWSERKSCCPHQYSSRGGLLLLGSRRADEGLTMKSLLYKASLLPTDSCLLYALHAFTRNFLIALTGQTLVTCLMKSPKSLIRDPIRSLRDALLREKRSLNFALFVASFAALFKASNCFIRRSFTSTTITTDAGHQQNNSSKEVMPLLLTDAKSITFVSGLVAGSAMLFSPSPTAAQYMMWKLIETIYFDAVNRGSVKYADITMNLLYAVSTAQLFYVAVMEPKLMRRSYTKWLNRMTRNSFGLLNRNIIDIFGTEASFGYEIPEEIDFDVKHCSEKFKESVLVWMI